MRPAAPADGPAIRRIVFAVLEEYGLTPDPAGADADLDDIQANYLDRGGAFHVVVADGAIVGCGGLYPLADGTAEIRKMYLLPAARGHGLGSAMLERLLDDARARGFRRVTLETASVLREAIALYRKRGFVVVEHENRVKRCDLAFALEL